MLLFLTTNMAAVTSLANQQYRKIPKISPGTHIFQRPFLRGFYTEENLGVKIDWASHRSTFTVFTLFYFVFKGNFPSTSPGGLIFGGA